MAGHSKQNSLEPVGGMKVYRWLLLSIIIVMVDQLSKQIVVQQMQLFQSIEVLPFFNFYYIHNYGAAFGFLNDQPGWQRWFFTIITSIISLGLLVWISKLRASQKLLILALVFVLGGALGNLYDRVVYGYVIDFIDWHVSGYHWPSFNIADAAISMGALLLILDTFMNPNSDLVQKANH